MENMKKRGISAIVATVLIILITVAAVTIIWAAIIPMITGNLEGSQACLGAASQVKIKNTGYTCVQIGRCQVSSTDVADSTGAHCQDNKTYCELGTNNCAGSTSGAGSWNASSGIVSLQIGVGAGDAELDDVQIRVYAGGNTVNAEGMDNLSTMAPSKGVPGANEEKTYSLMIGSDLQSVDPSTINKVEIAPIVRTGNTQTTCEVSSTVELQQCR